MADPTATRTAPSVFGEPNNGDNTLFMVDAQGGIYLKSGPSSASVRTATGTTDTLTASDNGNVVYYTNSSPVTASLPASLSGSGFAFFWIQGGTGKVTFSGTGGATVNGEGGLVGSSGTQWAVGSVVSPAANVFVVGGSRS